MDILEILGKVGFDTKVFLFNLINFIIVAAILRKFFFRKIMNTIEARQQLIEEGIQNAQAAKADLVTSKQKGEEIIKQAKLEANEVVKAAVDNANKAADSIKQQAELDAEATRARAKQQAAAEKEQMLSDFKQDAAELVIAATEKLLGTRDVKAEEAKRILNSVELKQE